ncbi:unnamed protein product [Lampetra planeri]
MKLPAKVLINEAYRKICVEEDQVNYLEALGRLICTFESLAGKGGRSPPIMLTRLRAEILKECPAPERAQIQTILKRKDFIKAIRGCLSMYVSLCSSQVDSD